MDFKIDAVLPASAAQLWEIFFDVRRVATLIPGCENVVEVEPLKEFSAVMKQKIGPFKLEVPTRIVVEQHVLERYVELSAAGSDKFTGTTLDVRLKVNLDEQRTGGEVECRLGVDAQMQVAGRLASLGYPIVKKRSEELFAEFERRLRAELAAFDGAGTAAAMDGTTHAGSASRAHGASGDDAASSAEAPAPINATAPSSVGKAAVPVERLAAAQAHVPPAQPVARVHPQPPAPNPRRTELVFVWPRVGITVAIGVGVAHGALAFGQSPWWWLVAPLLGAAAGLERRRD